MARGNTGGGGTRCFKEIMAKCTEAMEESPMFNHRCGARHVVIRSLRMKGWCLILLSIAASPAWCAAAVDLEELKRLARADTAVELQQEAAEKKKQEALAAANRPANQQLPAKAAALSGTASQMDKLAKGIEAAHAAAPNRWYQAARIDDITPPGDDQRKIYQVTTALGTYCIRYKDKNKADQGLANAGEPLIGACPHMF